jgi:hypothetical protein
LRAPRGPGPAQRSGETATVHGATAVAEPADGSVDEPRVVS